VKKQYKTIDEYINTFPSDIQDILEKMRQTVRKAAPGAVEVISYQMPTFKLNGKNLVHFAAWKNHIGFYPTPSGTEAFQKELSLYKGAKGSVQFPMDRPIPFDLVKKVVVFRVKENLKKKPLPARSNTMKTIKQKITPNLWFDSQAGEAANFYIATFRNSKLGNITRYGDAGAKISGRPKDSIMTVTFELEGQNFVALNGGPLFKFTPSVSFLVACSTKGEVDAIWTRLAEGGTALMELGEYPFSERYGWTQDRYGLSWQVMFMGDREIKQKITPTLLFVGEQCGKAETAINFYASMFHNSKVGDIDRYSKGEGPDKDGTVKHAAFTLEGQEFAAMESAYEHHFTFNEAISFMVECQTQEEIDYYWEKLAASGQESVCGWLKDKFGVSWQVTPTILDEMLRDRDKKKVERVTRAFLGMKKFDIAELEKAFKGDKLKEKKRMAKMDPVVHFEMPYENGERLVKFYRKVFGWQMQKLGKDMGDYVVAATTETDENMMIKKPGAINGGFFPRKPDWPAQYPSVVIAVGDIKQAMKKIADAGGKVLGEPVEIPGIGQYVSFVDTEGNRVSVLQPVMEKKE